MKNFLAFTISLIITIIFLDFIKLPLLPAFIIGSILWSIFHYKISKILKDLK